jgi:hypothetical protein
LNHAPLLISPAQGAAKTMRHRVLYLLMAALTRGILLMTLPGQPPR